jgi:hypothetical protein
MGTIDSHKILVQEAEAIFERFRELTVAHVHFNLHEA